MASCRGRFGASRLVWDFRCLVSGCLVYVSQCPSCGRSRRRPDAAAGTPTGRWCLAIVIDTTAVVVVVVLVFIGLEGSRSARLHRHHHIYDHRHHHPSKSVLRFSLFRFHLICFCALLPPRCGPPTIRTVFWGRMSSCHAWGSSRSRCMAMGMRAWAP